MTHCLLCGESLFAASTLDLGQLVACNQFKQNQSADSPTHQLSITECTACNLVQLSKYPPVGFVRPSQSWIRYNEPSAHLGIVLEQLKDHFPIGQGHIAMGVGPFDAPLLERMTECKFTCLQLDISKRLPQEEDRYSYLESMQALLRPDTLTDLASEQGTAKIVSCRYLLEHSHDPVASLKGLGHLMADDGLLLIEVPDSSKFLSFRDYSFIWEEHICYFTEDTFRACAMTAGYEVVQFSRYPGALEDALVFLLRTSNCLPDQRPVIHTRQNSNAFIRYQAGFKYTQQQYRNALRDISAQGKKVAIFGAGHQSIMFINALGLAQHISYAIDDAPEKIGYLLPGTSIPIVPSEYLERDPTIEVCLLGVSPNSELKIRNKCLSFFQRGGLIYSIFPVAGGATLIDGKT